MQIRTNSRNEGGIKLPILGILVAVAGAFASYLMATTKVSNQVRLLVVSVGSSLIAATLVLSSWLRKDAAAGVFVLFVGLGFWLIDLALIVIGGCSGMGRSAP